MGIFTDFFKRKSEQEDKKKYYSQTIEEGGIVFSKGKAKYLGGYANLSGEQKGSIAVNSKGFYFTLDNGTSQIFIPASKITGSGFKTGEEVSQSALFSRILAIEGFSFAKRRKDSKRIFLTLSYIESGVESDMLFEAENASEISNAIIKLRQQLTKEKLSVSELIKEIGELRALGILTPEEFAEKKKELLLRI